MNYFGHAAIALEKEDKPAFLFGAMLPDFIAMVNARPLPYGDLHFENKSLSDGVAFHLRTDALFHETSTFVSLNRKALSEMRELNVSRGPARACAHIGIEMLMDAALTQESRYERGYHAALAFGLENSRELNPFPKDDGDKLWKLCRRLTEGGLSLHRASTERLSVRLDRSLQNRARLHPSSEELRTIAPLLMGLFGEVSLKMPTLLQELSPLLDTADA